MGHDVNEKLTGDFYTKHFVPDLSEDGGTLILNIGPQHPATHGVLRVVVELDGEYIRKSEPVLGYIHRMHEKMGEVKTYPQYLPNMGRVDYLHALAWNWAYVGAVEKLMGILVPPRMYSARGGTRIPMSFSTAPTYAQFQASACR